MESALNVTSNISYRCYQIQVEGTVARYLFRYVFLFILLLAVCGNIANVILYHHKFLRTSPTVRMLTAKVCLLLHKPFLQGLRGSVIGWQVI